MTQRILVSKDFWESKRVLVTGDTGFKGSWLVFWLISMGAKVWGYSLPPDSQNILYSSLQDDTNDCIDYHGHYKKTFANILDVDQLRNTIIEAQPDIVIHMAAQPLVRESYKNPTETWSTNVLGSLNLLESLRVLHNKCVVVIVTTDKVYRNNEWDFGYRETDRLGGNDPYSASKAALELLVHSWRTSYCGVQQTQLNNLSISSARAGNVIGGGDYAMDRIIPDAIRSLSTGTPIKIRNPLASRPWQHVLEPLSGYLLLAQSLYLDAHYPSKFASAYNFGPLIESNQTVDSLISECLKHWPGSSIDVSDSSQPYESTKLHLQIDKAYNHLNWMPFWSFSTTVQRTVNWYLKCNVSYSPRLACLDDLHAYTES